jgi:hypothetical protein
MNGDEEVTLDAPVLPQVEEPAAAPVADTTVHTPAGAPAPADVPTAWRTDVESQPGYDPTTLPTWDKVEGSENYQQLSPEAKLVAFDRWHNLAYNAARSAPNWDEAKEVFNQGAYDKQQELSKAAGNIDPIVARLKLASAAASQGGTPEEQVARVGQLGQDVLEAWQKPPSVTQHLLRPLSSFGTAFGKSMGDTLRSLGYAGEQAYKAITGEEGTSFIRKIGDKIATASEADRNILDPRTAGGISDTVGSTAGSLLEFLGETALGGELLKGAGFGAKALQAAKTTTERAAAEALIKKQAGKLAGAGVFALHNGADALEKAEAAGVSQDKMLQDYLAQTAIGGAAGLLTPAQKWIARFDEASGGSLKKTVQKALVEGGQFGVQMLAQQLGNDVAAKAILAQNPDLVADGVDAAKSGGITGMIISFALSSLVHGRSAIGFKPAAPRAEAAPAEAAPAAPAAPAEAAPAAPAEAAPAAPAEAAPAAPAEAAPRAAEAPPAAPAEPAGHPPVGTVFEHPDHGELQVMPRTAGLPENAIRVSPDGGETTWTFPNAEEFFKEVGHKPGEAPTAAGEEPLAAMAAKPEREGANFQDFMNMVAKREGFASVDEYAKAKPDELAAYRDVWNDEQRTRRPENRTPAVLEGEAAPSAAKKLGDRFTELNEAYREGKITEAELKAEKDRLAFGGPTQELTAMAARSPAVENAQTFTREYWDKKFGPNAETEMIKAFENAPGVQESIKEGSDLKSAVQEYMSSAFNSRAAEHNIEPSQLYERVINELYPGEPTQPPTAMAAKRPVRTEESIVQATKEMRDAALDTGVMPSIQEIQSKVGQKAFGTVRESLRKEMEKAYPPETLPEGTKVTEIASGIRDIKIKQAEIPTGRTDARGKPITEVRPVFTNDANEMAALVNREQDPTRLPIVPEGIDLNPNIVTRRLPDGRLQVAGVDHPEFGEIRQPGDLTTAYEESAVRQERQEAQTAGEERMLTALKPSWAAEKGVDLDDAGNIVFHTPEEAAKVTETMQKMGFYDGGNVYDADVRNPRIGQEGADALMRARERTLLVGIRQGKPVAFKTLDNLRENYLKLPHPETTAYEEGAGGTGARAERLQGLEEDTKQASVQKELDQGMADAIQEYDPTLTVTDVISEAPEIDAETDVMAADKPRLLDSSEIREGNPLGLKPAARLADGTVVEGKAGQAHAQIPGLAGKTDAPGVTLGYTTGDGTFMDKGDAYAAVKPVKDVIVGNLKTLDAARKSLRPARTIVESIAANSSDAGEKELANIMLKSGVDWNKVQVKLVARPYVEGRSDNFRALYSYDKVDPTKATLFINVASDFGDVPSGANSAGLHEAAHHMTLQKLEPGYKAATPAEAQAVADLKAALPEARRNLRNLVDSQGNPFTHELSHDREFVVGLLTNSEFRDAVRNTRPNLFQRIWRRITDFIAGRKTQPGDIADRAIQGAYELVQRPVELSRIDLANLPKEATLPPGLSRPGEQSLIAMAEQRKERRLTGIKQEVLQAFGIRPGVQRSATALLRSGRAALAQGVDAQARIEELKAANAAPTGADFGLFRARGEQLGKAQIAAEDAAKVNPTPENVAAAEAAKTAAIDWAKQVKPFSTITGEALQAHTGAIDLDTGSYVGLQYDFQRQLGRGFEAKEATTARDIVERTAKVEAEITDARTKLDQDIKQQGVSEVAAEGTRAKRARGKTAVPSDEKGLTTYLAEKFSKQLPKIGAKNFTLNEVKAIWKFMGQKYLTGERPMTLEELTAKVSKDLSISENAVREVIVAPKALRKNAEALYRAQAQKRAIQTATRMWFEDTKAGKFGRAAKWIIDMPRAVTVLGHVNAPLTHGGSLLFQPTAWKQELPAILDTFRAFKSKATHEAMMQDILTDDLYPLFVKAGLAARVGAQDDVGAYMNFFRKVGLGGITEGGNRGMDVLKVLRMNRAKALYEGMSESERSNPDVIKEMVSLVNAETGTVTRGTKLGDALQGALWRNVFFAPRLEGGRWQTILVNPIRAIGLYGKSLISPATGEKATQAEKYFRSYVAKQNAQRAATYLSALAASQVFLNLTGSKHKINFTDPTASDWLTFKVGGKIGGTTLPERTIVPPSNFLAPLRLAAAVALSHAIPAQNRTSLGDRMWNYAQGKLSPTIGDVKELAQGRQSYTGRQLAFLPWAPKKGKIAQEVRNHPVSWYEWAISKGPIPVSQFASEHAHALHEKGVPPELAKILIGDSIAFAESFLAVHAHPSIKEKKKKEPFK